MKKLYILLLISQISWGQFGPGGPGGGRMGGGDGERRRPGSESTGPNLDGNAPKGTAKITGNIVNEDASAAVEYANVALYNKVTKKPVDGAMADDKGQFSIRRIAAGEYYLQVSFIGYETKIVEKINLEKGQDLNLGIIKIKEVSTNLNEVVVQGQASLIEEKVDRLVYNAEKDLNAKGGDASDVLKNVPMLEVDLDGNVSLRGSNNIRVLINNKPSTIVASSIADALKMIPADLIKTVEVITSPSAKYDAEGSSGIINIVTKKSSIKGLNLNAEAGAGLRGSNLSLSGNYRTGKMGFNLGGYGRANYSPMLSSFEQTLKTTGIRTNQIADGKQFMMFGRYTAGFDYDMGNKQTLSGSVSYGNRVRNSDQLLNSVSIINPTLTRITSRDVATIDNSNNIDVNLDYIKTFKPGREWSISAQYSSNFLINNFDADIFSNNLLDSRQKNINNNTNTEITLQTDYVHPLNSKVNIEGGAKAVLRNVGSEYEYLRAKQNANLEPDTFNPYGFLDYDQDVYAAYSSVTFMTSNKYNFKIGLRYEHTEIGGENQTANLSKSNIVVPAYDNLVPSINISKTKKTNTFKWSYSKRLSRPGLQQLNPNINLANPLNISYGNVNLNPELTDNMEFNFSKSKKRNYFSIGVFGRQTNNAITRVSFPSKTREGAIESTFENIGKDQSLGMNIYGNVFFTSKFSVSGGFNTYYKYLEGQLINLENISQTVSNDGLIVSGHLQGNLKLKKNWAIQSSVGSRGREFTLQGYSGAFSRYSIGARKDVGKKYSFGLSADNFFGAIKVRNKTESFTLSQFNTNTIYNSNVRFTFSYKIGNMRFVEEKKKVKNDDVKQGGQDN
jgi:ferric enterobactin receptor